jgi:hypothetical protein
VEKRIEVQWCRTIPPQKLTKEEIKKEIENAEKMGDFPKWSILMKKIGDERYKDIGYFGKRCDFWQKQSDQ